MDGCISVSLRVFYGKSDVWMNGWMHKCKFEIVVMVSQMYGWMHKC